MCTFRCVLSHAFYAVILVPISKSLHCVLSGSLLLVLILSSFLDLHSILLLSCSYLEDIFTLNYVFAFLII